MNEKANWPRWGLPAGIVTAVAVLVIVALVRDPVLLDPDSPEGTVQEYLQAISEERWEDAYAVLDEERFAGCSAADVASNAPGEPFTASLAAGDGSAVVERFEEVGEEGAAPTTTTPPDEETVVEVTLRFGESGPLGGGWTTYEVFEVVSREGFWWISGDPWPHFTWRCQ